MQFSLSPSVEVREYDLTQIIPSVATSIGAFAGAFEWGPAYKIVNLADEDQLVRVFGKPKTSNAADWFSVAGFLSYSNYIKTVRVVDADTAKNAVGTGTAALILNDEDFDAKESTVTANKVLAKYPGALGNSLKVSFADKDAFLTWQYRSEFSTATTAVNTTKVYSLAAGVTANTTNASALLTNVSNVDTFKVGMTVTGAGIPASTTVVSVVNATTVELSAPATATATGIAISGSLSVNLSVFPGQPTTSPFVEDLGGLNDELHCVVVDEDGLFTGVKGTILERFTKLSKSIGAKRSDGSSNYYKDVLNRSSNYIWISDKLDASWDNVPSTTYSPLASNITFSLSGGVDNHANIGSNERILGFEMFADAEVVDVSLVIGGAVTEEIADFLVDNVGERRKDCVVFISPPMDTVVGNSGNEERDIINFRNLLNNSTYAFFDSGWKYMYDKYNDMYHWVPLSADMAGLCANVDSVRDPWWSPAGFNRGYVKNVIKLAFNPTKKNIRDNLYQLGINSVVSFSGQGTVLYGDRTMTTKTSAFQYVNVRRLFIMIEKAIATYAKYTLFEFNDSVTQSMFVNTVTPYLRDIQGRRGIYEFAVVADGTVNTTDVIDAAGFVANILIKPSRSINFVRLNFAAIKTGATFSEVEL